MPNWNASWTDGRSKAALKLVQRSRPVPGQIAYVRQGEPLGLGHAVWCARRLIGNEPFAVLLADDLIMSEPPTLVDLVEVHEERGGNVLSLMEIDPAATSRYGVITPGEDDGRVVAVEGLVEKPSPEQAPSNLAIVGRYILQPAIMDTLDDAEREPAARSSSPTPWPASSATSRSTGFGSAERGSTAAPRSASSKPTSPSPCPARTSRTTPGPGSRKSSNGSDRQE